MATPWPRNSGALPRLITPPMMPSALQAWGMTGKGQARALQNAGRTWSEIYPTLDLANANVRALMAAINSALRNGTVWTIQIPYWQKRTGVGGGTPVVNGAGQTGASLAVRGGPLSTAQWLRAGDLFSLAGGSVVYDVTADAATDGAGHATLAINPPIFTALADGAALTIDPTVLTFNAIMTSIDGNLPNIDVSSQIAAGMTLFFRELPQ